MRCPYCQFLESRVLDSRVARDGQAIRRRRECSCCERRFTTFETAEERQLLVVKKDGRREAFDRGKLLRGIEVAFRKRPIAADEIEAIVDDVEREIYDRGGSEVQASLIGERVMEALRGLDPVAYVRFASVYRDFQDLAQFQEFLAVLKVECRQRRRPAYRKLGQRSPALSE